ncbi:alpha/beta hydrolase [Modestobacter sp. VKM Ac-2978]|uniref:alpha/beta hydrolase n=1 Tax=Modestobacter sp. VKM Ac-2978 TaxID=3004132 RepID=UPI0022AA73F5|nr:alpha/beta hydrolase [Modestobacter sp. VKM Ac-2978]MCZ2849915.1 alpha/beta hydrolase [Modestobacter sp. VKM Ac-2978]
MTAISAVDVYRDQVYRTVDDTGLHVDVFAPAMQPPRAAVAYFHGGGWQVGERTDYESDRAIPLAERGFVVASFQYRFSDVAQFPAQLDDARAAIGWLRSQAARYGIPGERVGAWGASAGGHLAALLALGNAEAGERPDVEAAVSWFAPHDLSSQTAGTPLERELFPPSSAEALLGGSFDASDPRHRAADPMSLVSGQAAPLLLVTGDRDRVVDGSVSVRLHEALVRARGASSLLVIGGAGHEDPRMDAPFAVGVVGAFFEEQLVSHG